MCRLSGEMLSSAAKPVSATKNGIRELKLELELEVRTNDC